jgi:hypothetical protein
MNPMMKRLDAIEAAHAEQNGDRIRCYVREADDETDEQARERLGLIDWPGILIPMSEADAKL